MLLFSVGNKVEDCEINENYNFFRAILIFATDLFTFLYCTCVSLGRVRSSDMTVVGRIYMDMW